MRIAKNLRLSISALAAHRARTALAIAGTAVGVAGVLVLTATGVGARHRVLDRIERLGRTTIIVTAATIEPRAGRSRRGDRYVRALRAADAGAIVAGAPAVVRAAPAQDGGRIARQGRFQTPVTVVGTTTDWLPIRRFTLAEGRFFDAGDESARARVAVLGAAARAGLFAGEAGVIGRTIRIGRVPFEVVGVLDSTGISVDGSGTEDDRIIVPLETAQRRLFNVPHVKLIYIEAAAPSATDAALAEAGAILRARHDPLAGTGEVFGSRSAVQLLDAQLEAQASFQRLILALGALSLVVGAAGILSIMLLSVRERRPEIGLRAAVGARRGDIALQFLLEAMMLAAAGGLLGVGLGSAAATVASAVTTWEADVTAGALMVAVGATAAVGIASGLLPAWRAAGLEPVEALRS